MDRLWERLLPGCDTENLLERSRGEAHLWLVLLRVELDELQTRDELHLGDFPT